MVAETEQAGSIRDAITEAVGGSEFGAELEAEADDLGELTPSVEPAAGGDEAGTGDGPDAGAESEAGAASTDDPPTVYWGTSLEGLSAEQRTEVIAALEQRDSTIQKLQQKLAQEPPAPEAPVDEKPVEITDEDILRALGIDPEGDTFEVEHAKRNTVPLARQLMALEEQVERITETEQVRETATAWNSELDRLEAEYGKLPGDRVKVLQYAASESIISPEVLYFRLTAPGRKAVEEQVAKVKAKKAEGGGLRPRSNAAGEKVFEAAESLRDTVKKAALAAQEETGKRWSDVLRQQ